MNENNYNINTLIVKAINASIEFEELMEKIDFNSWFEDTDEKMLTNRYDKNAFKQYTKRVKEAEKICKRFILDKNSEKEFVEGLLQDLFKAKLNRLEARRASELDIEKNKYIEGVNTLHLALNRIPLEYLQKSSDDDRKKDYDLLMILLYNDLSICYSGLKNSSMSRGYAEESIKLIEEDEDYKKFRREIDNIENKIDSKIATEKDYKKLSTLPFVSGECKKYDLYTFALFCRGVAEFRSFLKEEAEKTFMQIINFVCKFKFPENSDYFSTLIQLASLLIDLGRGKESIKMLEMNSMIDKTDRRWAESLLEKASALIDQSRYTEARDTLDKLFCLGKSRNERLAEPILNGQIYYGRSYLEEARNVGREKEDNLRKAKEELEKAYKRSKERKQKNLIQKAAKYIAEVYQERKNQEDTLTYYSISISEGEVKDFSDLLKNDWNDFVMDCEDIDILDNFSKQICDFISATFKKGKECNDKISFCLDLLDKLRKECDEKENLVLSEQAERRKEEIELIQQGKKGGIPETLQNNKFKENYEILTAGNNAGRQNDDLLLTAKQMQARLDSNERTFNKALYGRTDKRTDDSPLVELIVLRRWNSFSPGLSKRYAISLGGGHLLRIWAPEFNGIKREDSSNEKKNDQNSWFNIVVDPGYNFLLNFHSENFKVEDIDAVVVTHSHPDHCAELSGIMDLMRQINKRQTGEKNRKRVYLLLSKGAYKKFSPYTQDWKKQLKDVVLLEDKTKWPETDQEFEITAIQTAHADLGGVRAIGIFVKIKGNDGILLGFTGDTPWRKYIREKFKNCDILCLHMGGVKYEEIGYNKEGKEILKLGSCCESIRGKIKEANHLLFYGSKDIIDNCKPDALVIVGEFGEELKYGLRTDLVKKLNLSDGPLCVPADAGLYLVITDKKDKKIRCDFCRGFVSPEKIKVFAYGMEDSLHYICDACHHTLNESQKKTIIEHWLTRH